MASLNHPNCMYIADDFEGYPKKHFCIPSHYEEYVGNVLIPSGMIHDRIEKIALDIFNNVVCENPEPISAICVLKGGYRFFSDLINCLNRLNTTTKSSVQFSIDFIRVKSYVDDKTTGCVKITGIENLEKSLNGKNVLIVEDVIDTGLTMTKLLAKIKEYSPKSVTVASLIRKRSAMSNGFSPDYVGFEFPDKFMVGYNCDYNEYFRDLAHICYISEKGKEHFRAKEGNK